MSSKILDINKYKYGFTTDIESFKAPKGLSEETIKFISKKKESKWLLEWRLKLKRLKSLKEPSWQNQNIQKLIIKIHYYSVLKVQKMFKSLAEVDPKLIETYKTWNTIR